MFFQQEAVCLNQIPNIYVQPETRYPMETQFLKELIENNARVILPDFGAFLVKDDGTGVFKPQNVTFSPFLRYNDGMVEEKLATKLKLGKDQAKEKLESFIEMLKSELQSKKIFVIQGLGSLQIDSRGSIQFSTLQSASSAGKASPKPAAPSPPEAKPKPAESKAEKPEPTKPEEPILPKSKETVKKAEEQPKVAEPKPKATEETLPPPVPVEETKPLAPKQTKPTKAKPTPMPKQKSSGGAGKAILFGTLIGIGFVVVAASGWYLYDKGVFSSNKKEKVVPPTAERVATIPSDQQKQDQQKGKFEDEFEQLSAEMDESNDMTRSEQTAKPAEKKISKSPSTTEPKLSIPVTQEGMFHIVAGSFRNAEYAEKFSRDMQSLGYNSKVIMQSTGMHAVTLGSFLTRQQAVDSMNVWKQKNPNIWILNQ